MYIIYKYVGDLTNMYYLYFLGPFFVIFKNLLTDLEMLRILI